MDQNFKEKTLENITKAEAVSVLVSKAGGFDGLAAGLALYLSLTKLEKKVNILAQAPTVSDARRLYGVDYIGKTEKDNNLVIVINDAVATVDKVTYFLDKNNFLYRESGEKKINDNALVALALLIAISNPKDKEVMIKIITNLLQ